MAEDKKQFRRWVRYDILSDEQKKEFKKALFLTKGAANNNVGCMLAYFGLDAEAIAEFGALWKDAEDVDQGEILRKQEVGFTNQMKQARRLIEQQYKRVPQLFDTIKGRFLVAKYGDDIKQGFCNANGKCALSVVDRQIKPMGKFAGNYHCVESIAGGMRQFDKVIEYLRDTQNVAFDGVKKHRLDFLAKISPVENAKASAKGFDLGKIYTASVNDTVDIEYYQDLAKDFWGFFTQDLYGLANAPIEQFKKSLNIGEDANLEQVINTEVSIIGRISEDLTGRSYLSQDVYSTQPNATYNALYIRALYQAMDEMGVGIATSSLMLCRHSRGKFKTRVTKIARKVIFLNEKYQKMLKSKSNNVEPAILRDTLVGMYNEWADRSGIKYRMFVREDRPAPTLAELKPAKVKAKAKAKKASKKASTEPKEVVEVEGVGTFVEY